MRYDTLETGLWMYNFGDEENWNEDDYYDTKEEAIENGRLEGIDRGETQYQVGQISMFCPSICAESIIENIEENAYDECGEHGEDCMSCTKEELNKLQNMLDETLNKWMDETNNRPMIYKIENSRNFVIDEE